MAKVRAEQGWPVRVALYGNVVALKGDAAWAADQWLQLCRDRQVSDQDAVEPLSALVLGDIGLVVDALFGAGLARGLDDACRAVLAQVQQRRSAPGESDGIKIRPTSISQVRRR